MKMKLMALLMGALFLCVGAASASEEMKCGAGKCGSAKMEKPACKNCATIPADCQCADKSKCSCKNTQKCDCKQGGMKCGDGKCGKAGMEKPACKNCAERPANCGCQDKAKCTCKNSEKCNCQQGPKAIKCGSGK